MNYSTHSYPTCWNTFPYSGLLVPAPQLKKTETTKVVLQHMIIRSLVSSSVPAIPIEIALLRYEIGPED